MQLLKLKTSSGQGCLVWSYIVLIKWIFSYPRLLTLCRGAIFLFSGVSCKCWLLCCFWFLNRKQRGCPPLACHTKLRTWIWSRVVDNNYLGKVFLQTHPQFRDMYDLSPTSSGIICSTRMILEWRVHRAGRNGIVSFWHLPGFSVPTLAFLHNSVNSFWGSKLTFRSSFC